MNRTMKKQDGTFWSKMVEEAVRLYKQKGKSKVKDKSPFKCFFANHERYDNLMEKIHTNCIAAQMLEGTNCDSLIFNLGVTAGKKSTLCWMATTGMVCGYGIETVELASYRPLFEHLRNHSEPIAQCASVKYFEKLDEEGEEDYQQTTTGSDIKYEDRKPRTRTVMWNETARILSILGFIACLLLFLQIIVLAMSAKLVRRQAFRG
ncbi:hypothetical protein V3C99_001061 [Haemonchus contortus]